MDGWWRLVSSLRAVSTHWIAGPAVGPSLLAASPASDRRAPASASDRAAASGPLGNSESAPAPASVVVGLVWFGGDFGPSFHPIHADLFTGKHQS